MKVRVRVGSLDEESSQDEEAFYDMSSGRLSRWERVAIAAVKQSLRSAPSLHESLLLLFHSPHFARLVGAKSARCLICLRNDPGSIVSCHHCFPSSAFSFAW